MSYERIPDISAPEAKYKDFLNDIASRREFYGTKTNKSSYKLSDIKGYKSIIDSDILEYDGLHIHAGQLFVSNFANIKTPWNRLLIYWKTGKGKTRALTRISSQFINHIKVLSNVPIMLRPSVYVICFSRRIIQRELLQDPIYGFISKSELKMQHQYQQIIKDGNADNEMINKYNMFMGNIKRRMTTRHLGGYYKFYGYKKFANIIFQITQKGIDENIDILSIYSQEADFHKGLNTAVKNGFVIINTEFIEQMKHSLIIADEIHNVYNINSKNNYGIAIQYVLDILGNDAPRVVFTSATPISGSATEIVDILNLLNDKTHVSRSELFSAPKDGISVLKPHAISIIKRMSIGRVSYLPDDESNFPQKILVGKSYPSIKYMKFIACEMSDYQSNALEKMIKTNKSPTIALDSYAITDMVFPDPTGSDALYKKVDIISKLSLPNNFISIETSHLGRKIYTLRGHILQKSKIQKYSAKCYYMLELISNIIKSGPGKIMIYHPKVMITGVLLIQEILRENGFIADNEIVRDNTICSICMERKNKHLNITTHGFQPARFITIYGDIDDTIIERMLLKYNSISNNDGYECRILIGSKKIQEGYDLVGVKHEIFMALPIDVSSYLQSIGRTSRRNSHVMFPVEERYVKIYVLISTSKFKKYYLEGSPELNTFKVKMHEYEVIQLINRVLMEGSVDGFLSSPITTSTIETLAYNPICMNVKPTDKYSTYEAYGYIIDDFSKLKNIIHMMFLSRVVWKAKDLYNTIINGYLLGNETGTHYIDYITFKAALYQSSRLWTYNDIKYKILHVPPFYILTQCDKENIPLLYYDCFIDNKAPDTQMIKIPLKDELIISDKMNQIHVDKFIKLFNKLEHKDLILICGTESVHICIIKQIIETGKYPELAEIYKLYNIIISSDKISNSLHDKLNIPKNKLTLIGYIFKDSFHIYNKHWIVSNMRDVNLKTNSKENEIVTGISTTNSRREIVFKIRQASIGVVYKDIRSVLRGMICESQSWKVLNDILSKLVNYHTKYNITLSIDLPPNINISTSSMHCTFIKILLLNLEKLTRLGKLTTNLRWMYLFNDIVIYQNI